MRRIYHPLLTIILMLLLIGCASTFTSQPVEPQAAERSTDSVPPTKSVPSNTDSKNPYLNCLSPTLKMNVEHAAHTATLLPDGRVLIAGGFREEGTSEIAISSAEIFDPTTHTFTLTGDMNEPRDGHSATLLPDGHVLITGGWNQNGRSATAELYDPETGVFSYTGSMMSPRDGMTATLLKNGKVLIAGGSSARNTLQIAAEIYDPVTGEFTPAGDLNVARRVHTATLLKDGRVLFVGGNSDESVLASAEIYDPVTGEFLLINHANQIRHKHSAVLLENGRVLIIGGSDDNDWKGQYDSAEIYDPDTDQFIQTFDMNEKRFKLSDAAILLPDGNVLISGGNSVIEIFDSQTEHFIPGGELDKSYYDSDVTLLKNGSALITGGYDTNIQPSDKAWLYC